MIFSLIVCCDKNYGIGKDNKLPWNYSKDMEFFKSKTLQNVDNNKMNVVIMGNNTYKSIPNKFKPLKNRFNLVLTKEKLTSNYENLLYFNNIYDILLYLDNNKDYFNDVYIIGGNQIYNIFLDLHIIKYIYITMISELDYNCDTFFNFNKYKKYYKINENDIYFEYDNLSTLPIKKKNRLEGKKYTYLNKDETNYLNTIQKVLNKGIYKLDRTKVGTLSIFGKSFKYNIRNYRLPLFTHRKMFYRGIIEELLFFISGNTNTKLLEEKNVKIWTGNTSREFLDSRSLNHLDEGDLGAGYSFQLRHFGAEYINCNTDYTNKGFDQLKYIIDLIKNDPNSRRILFSYWNPLAMKNMVLPPCHILYQFHVNTDKNELSCSFYQRSSDFVLAANFNIVSAAVLTFMLCHITGYKPGKIIHNIGDLHIYKNHIEETKKMLNNTPNNFPLFYINDPENNIKNIEDFKYSDFKILFYNSYKKYNFTMAI
jgi:dihydrofolate reductase/thymidylate synthase